MTYQKPEETRALLQWMQGLNYKEPKELSPEVNYVFYAKVQILGQGVDVES